MNELYQEYSKEDIKHFCIPRLHYSVFIIMIYTTVLIDMKFSKVNRINAKSLGGNIRGSIF